MKARRFDVLAKQVGQAGHAETEPVPHIGDPSPADAARTSPRRQLPAAPDASARTNAQGTTPDPNAERVAGKKPGAPIRRPRMWLYVLPIMLLLNWLIAGLFVPAAQKPLSLPYSEFLAQLDTGNLVSVNAKGTRIEATLRTGVRYPVDSKSKANDHIVTERPTFADDKLLAELRAKRVTISARPLTESRSLLETLLINIGPTLLLVAVMVWFWRRAAGNLGGVGGLGRSKAEVYVAPEHPTTFADVAGIDEAVAEVAETVDFLRNPGRYRAIGAYIPRGVLLLGPPGTGKTLLARALAGESGVPFFAMSASEFVEMIVGVGASRVRDLFAKAKAVAPSIVFIDELDAIGRARGGSVSFGGHDEREQTLNQILTEMDGFSSSDDVIVVAATNRAEILDPALLRPGRFDRHIAILPPDRAGRAAVLRVHTRSVPLAPDADLDTVAASTPGMVGADLRNLVNEAALLAARLGHQAVTEADFSEALERILLGAPRHLVLSVEDRTRTAVHEAGHALVGMLQPGADPVRKISIIPRGRALGVTFQSPDDDRVSYSESYLRGRIVGALAGRAAEQLVFHEVTSGAESDLEVASGIARQMIGRWGMSDEIGPVSVLSPGEAEHGEVAAGFGMSAGIADETRRVLDTEVRQFIEDASAKATQLLVEHRPQLDRLVAALLEHETLDEADAYAAAGIEHAVAAGRLQPPSAGKALGTGDPKVAGIGDTASTMA